MLSERLAQGLKRKVVATSVSPLDDEGRLLARSSQGGMECPLSHLGRQSTTVDEDVLPADDLDHAPDEVREVRLGLKCEHLPLRATSSRIQKVYPPLYAPASTTVAPWGHFTHPPNFRRVFSDSIPPGTVTALELAPSSREHRPSWGRP